MTAERDQPDADDATGSALARGMVLLEAFGIHEGWLGNAELVRRTGFSRSTVSRLCATLAELGYLRRDARGRVQPGLQLLALAQPLLRELPLRQRARPLLQDLANQIGGAAALVTRQDLLVLPVEAARSPALHAMRNDIQLDDSLASTSAGRALLAQLDQAARAEAIRDLQTQGAWPQWSEKVSQSLQDCRAQGYCVSFDDDDPRWRSLGLPLLCLADGLPLALQVAVPAYRFTAQRLVSEVAPRCLLLAAELRVPGLDT